MASAAAGPAIEHYSSSPGRYNNNYWRRRPTCRSPSSFINSIFMSTVNTAARTLVSISSTSKTDPAANNKWRPADHLRFIFMLVTWFTLWFLRVLMDYFPSLCPASPPPDSPSSYHQLQGDSCRGSLDFRLVPPLLTNYSSSSLALAGPSPPGSSSALSLPPYTAANSQMDMILYEGEEHEPSVDALGRALSHILALLNEIPAASRKYQFAMAMADRILDDNATNGRVELLHINRTALASAFARTSTLLYCSLNLTQQQADHDDMMTSSWWPARILRSLPMGNYIASYVKGISAVIRYVSNACTASGGLTQLNGGGGQSSSHDIDGVADHQELAAEKLAQELLWIIGRMRDYGAVEEALEQWSFSSALASASLEASPRVQGFIIKISAMLFGELMRDHHQMEAGYSREVKVGMLMLWLPLCCHASNGVSYPILTRLEKVEVERAMDQVISSLPQPDQELILTTWFHDFTTSASDWPNLQVSYDRWCHCTRKLV